jgi:hypothetical protein
MKPKHPAGPPMTLGNIAWRAALATSVIFVVLTLFGAFWGWLFGS